MTTNAVRPPPAQPRGKSEYVSQSECRDAQRCHLRWFARWPLALQNAEESPPQRIGSIGHACLGAMSTASLIGEDADDKALRSEAICEGHRRNWFAARPEDDNWPDWFETEFERGLAGARLIDANVPRGLPVRLLDGAGPAMIEHRLRVTWAELFAIVPPMMRDSFARIGIGLARLGGRTGIEGQPDLVHRLAQDGSNLFGTRDHAVVYIDDYKFRQKPDLGGALGKADLTTIDPQGAFYSVLLRASGAVGPDEPVAFRQINAYAGPWLTVEDFVEERRRVQASGARGKLTLDSGLPSCDVGRMEAMVTPEVWSEAHRVLVNLRHDDRRAQHEYRLAQHRQAHVDFERFKLENPRSRKQPPRPPTEPERTTAAEDQAARAFVADLASRPLHQVQTCSLDPGACLELVRDMLAAVLSAETEIAARLPPARSFDPHPRGLCVRPYGCDLLAPCKASLGSNNAEATLRDHAEQARLRRSLAVLPTDVGDDPSEA